MNLTSRFCLHTRHGLQGHAATESEAINAAKEYVALANGPRQWVKVTAPDGRVVFTASS